MLGNRARRVAMAAAGLTTWAALAASPAFASASKSPDSYTDHTSEASVNPCTGAPGTWDTDATIDEYMLTNDGGHTRYAISIRGTVTFVPDAADGVTYRGPFTLRYTENDGDHRSVSAQTTRVTLTGADGSSIAVLEHSHARNDGTTTVETDRSNVHCS